MPGKTPQQQVVYPSGVRGNPCHWEQHKVFMSGIISEIEETCANAWECFRNNRMDDQPCDEYGENWNYDSEDVYLIWKFTFCDCPWGYEYDDEKVENGR